jgi:asparagine synthase (glutamine-hydrolysing)
MQSGCGRYVLAFNGEIYNHLELRRALVQSGDAPSWRGQSDTETLLAVIAARGILPGLRSVRGMFALALWDRETRALHLARDPMGEKPLYYGKVGGLWTAASELHALRAMPGAPRSLDATSVIAYLARGYVPDGRSIHAGIRKLRPGRMLTLRVGSLPVETSCQDFESLAVAGKSRPLAGDERSRVGHIEEVLSAAVRDQMISDVPLGCFLSGGIDSSLVAALMQASSARRVETFSVGLADARFDESPHAAAVARHLGCAHTAFRLSEREAQHIIPDLPRIYDEPFADSSQIPTALLCRAVRGRVTVALTGDGADELFGGYNRHVLGPRLLRRLAAWPRALRRPLGRALQGMEGLGARHSALHRLSARAGLPHTLIDKLGRLGGLVSEVDDVSTLYAHLSRGILDPEAFLTNKLDDPVADPVLTDALAELTEAEWLMAQDSLGYLPGDILVKVDRAAMAASLETRAPFLDPRVVRAAWALPQGDRIAKGRGKVILREVLARYVPVELTDRPKQGFAIPLDRWLREGLRDWAETLLSDRDLFHRAGLDSNAVGILWSDHIAQRRNEGQKLWTVLMLLAWVEQDLQSCGRL